MVRGLIAGGRYAVAFAVLTGAAVVASCSDATTPPADGTSSGSTSSGSSSGSTSSSGSSGGAAQDAGPTRPASCAPAGTYAMGKKLYVGSGGKVCENYAEAGNSQPTSQTIVFTKDDEDTYSMRISGDAQYVLKLFIADDRCQLAGGEQPVGQLTQDASGKQIEVKIAPSHLFDFDGDTVTDTASVPITSDTPGATGVPCSLTVKTTGTRAK